MARKADQPLSYREWCLARVLQFVGSPRTFEPYGTDPRVGDLVLLRSAPPSLFSISIVDHFEPVVVDGRQIDTKWLLRAMGTEEQCWWSNVGFLVFRRYEFDGKADGIFQGEELRLTEAQFAFWQKWQTEARKADLYMLLQRFPDFSGNRASCGWRIRFSLGETATPPAVFDDITKVTRPQMREAISKAVAFYEAETEEQKRQRELAVIAVGEVARLLTRIPSTSQDEED